MASHTQSGTSGTGPNPPGPPPTSAAKPPAAAKPAAAVKPPAPPKPTSPPAAPPPAAAEIPRRSAASAILRTAPAWAVSMLLHIVILLSMALIVQEPPKEEKPRVIVSTAPEVVEEFEEFEEVKDLELPKDSLPAVQESTFDDTVALPDSGLDQSVEVATTADDLEAAQSSIEFTDFAANSSSAADLLTTVGVAGGTGSGFGGRMSTKIQAEMIKENGSDANVLKNVDGGIEYFIRHQLPDGGWSFDCQNNPSCRGNCPNPHKPAFVKDRVAATALALLPCLGKGYTHTAEGDLGEYQTQIARGLVFLARNVGPDGKAYSPPGNMYSQALAAIVLSEAYGMTQDRALAVPAQAALNFIMASQDPMGGGWKYAPRQPGDVSSVCWQVLALKSGRASYLNVNPTVVRKVSVFLDYAQADDGAAYGYADPSSVTSARTAAGLLSRMFTGWKKTNAPLLRGAKKLASQGPSTDMYHNYYATQVLYHLKKQMPDEWDKWRTAMERQLLRAQCRDGHRKGSFLEGLEIGHAAECGGIFYLTSMAVMTLEVYFKHGAPLYSSEVVDDFRE